MVFSPQLTNVLCKANVLIMNLDKSDFLSPRKLAEVERKMNISSDPNGPFTLVFDLLTQHFLLRPLKSDDFENLFLAASDPLIWELHPVPNRWTKDGFAVYWHSIYSQPGSLAIVDRQTNRIIGSSTFYEFQPESKEITIGYTFLKRDFWGGKFNFEIKKAMMNYAFKFVEKVNFHVGSQNYRSRSALKKIGARQVNQFDKTRSDGSIITNVVYQIDKLKPTYRKADVTDIPQIKLLMEQTFGPFPDLELLFTKWILNSAYSVSVAELNEVIIGVSTCAVKQDSDFSTYLCFGKSAIQKLQNKKVASVVNLAINPEYRGQRIGTRLAMTHLDWLEKQKCDVIFGTSWVNGTKQNSSHLFENAGFQKISESAEFLRGQMQIGAICSVCNLNQCGCNSILYIADVSTLNRRTLDC